jgi:hypothetical protein
MNAWLTTEESKAIRKHLASKLSFESIGKKHCNRVEPISSSTWTHKCTCPFHKGGHERTPSLHLSDKEKTFFCYGCSAHGDIFDFIGMIRGTPGDAIALRYKEINNIDVDLSEVGPAKPRVNVQEINLQIGVAIRDYIAQVSDANVKRDEIIWADSIFKRVDERFSKLTDDDGEQARNFYMQIMLELDRRRV